LARKKQEVKFARLPYSDNAEQWIDWLIGGKQGECPPMAGKVPGDRNK
jgi:hypothetical protein